MNSRFNLSNPDARYFLAALIVGSLVGIAGGYFHRAIDALSQWPQWLAGVTAGYTQLILSGVITMVITLACVIIVRHTAPEASGSGVQEIEGTMAGVRTIRWRRVLPVKFLGGIFSIASGLVLGREGPTIHIGASISAWWAEKNKMEANDHKGLLAAGAAAGLACAFNAPVASMIFVTEEMKKQFPYSFRNYMGVGIACVMSTIFTQWIVQKTPDLHMVLPDGLPALYLMPAFAVLGAILGAFGVALNRGLLVASDMNLRWHARIPYSFPATIGLIVGLLVVIFPDSVTGGEHMIQAFNFNTPTLGILLLLVITRFFTTTASYASGVPGGIFAPILSLAMCTGLAFGTAGQLLAPEWGINPVIFGIVAMGGLFSASVHAPTVGIILIAELTGTYSLLLPLTITCLSSYIVAKWLGGRPIYEELLERVLRLSQADQAASHKKQTS